MTSPSVDLHVGSDAVGATFSVAGDPEREPISIDDELWTWLKNASVVNVDGRKLRLGTQEIPTAHAAALVASYGSRGAWSSYFTIHRSGALGVLAR